MIAAVAVVLVAALALFLQHRLAVAQDHRLQHLLDTQAAERLAWAQERNELNTRIQAPELVRVAPPAPPAPPAGEESEADDDVDESHLVGTAA